ncbi:MAG: thiamine pyrophosphate-dependent enzyme [Candidatus Micrarchaeia archaeon]
MVYESKVKPVWCPGCGNFGVFSSLKRAFEELKIEKHKIAIISDIGCSSQEPHLFSTYGLDSLHGRVVAVATGTKLANSELLVIAVGGDGGIYGEGLNHLINAARRNIGVKVIAVNNGLFSLTIGQVAPTTLKGMKTKTTPYGNPDNPITPIPLMLSSFATFVARGFSGDVEHLTYLIKEGIKHKGFALIDILSPCVTFNKLQTYEWYRQRVYKLEEKKHDKQNFEEALKEAFVDIKTNYEKIPIGVFYQKEEKSFEEIEPILSKGVLIKRKRINKDELKEFIENF